MEYTLLRNTTELLHYTHLNSSLKDISVNISLEEVFKNDSLQTNASSSAKTDQFTQTISTIILTLFVFLTVVGAFGNFLVILVVATDKTLKQPTYLLVLNLAVADLLFILICIPFSAVRYTASTWIFGDKWCKVVNYLNFISAWGSAYTLMLLCIDRLLAIVFAVKSKRLRIRRNYILAIIISWIGILLANIPTWMYHGIHEYNRDGRIRKTCRLLSNVGQYSIETYHLINFLVGFALPVAVMVILYTIIIVFLKRQNSLMVTNSTRRRKTKRRVAKVVVIVVVVFIICWFPIHIILIMSNYGVYKNSKMHVIIQISANCLAYMNSCINPLIYTISSSIFKKAFKKFLCRMSCSIGIEKKDTKSSSQSHSTSISKSGTIVVRDIGNTAHEQVSFLPLAHGASEKCAENKL